MLDLDEAARTHFAGIKVRIWVGACRKWKYLDEDAAWEDVRDQQRKRRKRKAKKLPVPHHVYLCRHCGGYHMTHAKQKGER